jgi:hypothetical protein
VIEVEYRSLSEPERDIYFFKSTQCRRLAYGAELSDHKDHNALSELGDPLCYQRHRQTPFQSADMLGMENLNMGYHACVILGLNPEVITSHNQ